MTRTDIPEKRVMLGGFVAHLTGEEENSWHDYAVSLPEFNEHNKIKDILDYLELSIRGGTAEEDAKKEYLEYKKKERDMTEFWYSISLKWYTEKVVETENAIKKVLLDEMYGNIKDNIDDICNDFENPKG